MTNSWERRKLGDICSIKYGFTSSANTERVGPKFLRITDIQDDHVCWDTVPYCEIASEKLPLYRLKTGDIVFSRTGATTGKSFLVLNPPEAIFASYLIRLRISDNAALPEFVNYYFQTSAYWQVIADGSVGSAQGGFNASKLGDLRVPLPPVTEQRRIVAILDEALEGIATAKANAESASKLTYAAFEAHREQVFFPREGWEQARLSELCEIKHGFAFQSEFFTSEGDFVLLTPGNYFERGGYRDRREKQKFYKGPIPDGFVFSKNALLVAMTEQAAGLLGSSLLVPDSGRFLHNQRLGLVVPKPNIPWENDFFFHFFNTRAVRSAIHRSASGVKVRHTSPTKIGEVVATFPTSREEQLSLASKLFEHYAETEKLEDLYERKFGALEALKQSLLYQAFSGNL